MENMNPEQVNWLVKAFSEGGIAMYFIAAVGIMVTLLIVERFINIRKLTIDKKDIDENLFGRLVKGDLKEAVAYCDSRPAPITNTIKAGLIEVMNQRSDEEIQAAMDAEVLDQTPQLEGWTGFLAVFGNVATLIGLMGTIVGLIHSFGAIANQDAAQRAMGLSAGIAEALNCTAFGLLVAIVAIVAYGYFQTRVQKATNEILSKSMKLMNLVASNRDKLQKSA